MYVLAVTQNVRKIVSIINYIYIYSNYGNPKEESLLNIG